LLKKALEGLERAVRGGKGRKEEGNAEEG